MFGSVQDASCQGAPLVNVLDNVVGSSLQEFSFSSSLSASSFSTGSLSTSSF